MKYVLSISAVLSWIVLVVGSILVFGELMMAMVSPGLLNILTGTLLTSSVVLHSYAAMQLRKSIVHPDIPLSRQTPAGIRFIGLMALFFAILIFGNAYYTLGNTQQMSKLIELPPQYKDIHFDMVRFLRISGILCLLFSLCIMINVVLNFRLLRWYQMHLSD